MKETLSVLVSIAIAFALTTLVFFQVTDKTPEKIDALIVALNEQNEQGEGNLGAATGPDMPFRYLNVGGVKTFYNYSGGLLQGTSSVICTIQSPAGTSTLEKAGIQLNTGTSTATSLSATKSTAPFVLGTVISSTTVASASKVSIDVSSSTWNQTAINDRIFSPNTYLVFSQLGGGILNQTGSCFATFTQF